MNPETKAALAALQNYHLVYVLLAISFLITGVAIMRTIPYLHPAEAAPKHYQKVLMSFCFILLGASLLMYFLGGALVPERLLVIQRIP